MPGKGQEDGDAQKKLEAYGEAFMRMFDDYDSEEERKRAKRPRTAPAVDPGNASSEDASSDEDESSGEDDVPRGKAQLHTPADPPSSRKQQPEEVVFLDKLWKSRGAGGGMDEAARKQKAEQEALEQLKRRREMKKFMSAKVSLVHEELDQERLLAAHKKMSQQQQSLQGSEAGGEPTAEEFAALQREVEEMGAGQLDKKALKQWKARQLQQMGAKAPKMQRTGATIGVGMAKHRRKVEARQLQEAIETGMVQAKGLGKKKRREASKNEKKDPGLREVGGGSFKKGVLFIKKPAVGRR